MILGKNPKDFKQKFKQNGCFQINLGQRQSITRSAAPAKSRTVNPGDANPYDSEKSFDLHSAGTLEPPRLTIFVKKNDTCTRFPLGCCFPCMVGDRNQNHSRNVLRQLNLGQFSLNSAFFDVQTPKKRKQNQSFDAQTHVSLLQGNTKVAHHVFIQACWMVTWTTIGSRNHVSSQVSQLFFPCRACLCCFCYRQH